MAEVTRGVVAERPERVRCGVIKGEDGTSPRCPGGEVLCARKAQGTLERSVTGTIPCVTSPGESAVTTASASCAAVGSSSLTVQ